MHTEMWEHASVQENLATLRRRGVIVVPPEEGRLAGGDAGVGRLAEPSVIADRVLAELSAGRAAGHDLAGRRILVSAGGTREPLDPVRFLTNRSSGKQGHALAEAAARRGAEVMLVTASNLPVHAAVTVVRVETAAEMEQAMLAHAPNADAIVMAAAVADFRPKVVASAKLTKEDGVPEIVLEPTPDILRELAARRTPAQVLVGFAAETNDVIERGERKLKRKGVDLLVVNDVTAPGAGFDHDTNVVTILDANGGAEAVPLASKLAVANAVLDRVSAQLKPERT
jgi:phosphopantothenoylcysteine decarboxylase/phosphopantothenate--cysteine ligase